MVALRASRGLSVMLAVFGLCLGVWAEGASEPKKDQTIPKAPVVKPVQPSAKSAQAAPGAKPGQPVPINKTDPAKPAPKPPAKPVGPPVDNTLLPAALQGTLKDVEEVVYVARSMYEDPHWYANFGYWSQDAGKPMYAKGGSRLLKLNIRTGKVTPLLDDPAGSIRDPQVHYDAKKILFAYRKGHSQHFHLYEINVDGSGLRQLTDGPFDDFEPTYLPNNDIVFVSSRCKRWVSCWFTQVAILHRCDANGRNIRSISANIEQDNTPSVLPDGRLLYTRWEYVDRSQVEFHHLWTSNPDGTNVQTMFGNMHPGLLLIDAKPIPGTNKAAVVFSPGHGVKEHQGPLHVVTPEPGPDNRDASTPVPGTPGFIHDPWPLSEMQFIAARKFDIVLIDGKVGAYQILVTDKQELHEPMPIRPRQREAILPDRTNLSQSTGKLVLADVNVGRKMTGVKPGEIKKLMVVEALPKPINFSGGMEPLSAGGTFNLERVLGTVPVEPDGSAYFELPANRALFLIGLDEKGMSVKRMQSFLSVMPGETTSCVGCHEQRTQSTPVTGKLMALQRQASSIEPFAGVPEIIDFPRDVQPVLDQHCVKCHSYEKPDGRIVLTGDRGPMYSQSYWTLIFGNQVSDGANGYGNRAPRAIGTSASPLMKKIDGSHYGVKLDATQWRLIANWIESGAVYPGTYSALGSGSVGPAWPSVPPANVKSPGGALSILQNRCGSCHTNGEALEANKVALHTRRASRRPGDAAHQRVIIENDPNVRRASQVMYNLSTPKNSIALLAPLAKAAGGWGVCETAGKKGPVFKTTDDPDYKALLVLIDRRKAELDSIKRFDMPDYVPNEHYLREMKRYGVLPASFDPAKEKIDVYKIDKTYFESLWWKPAGGLSEASPAASVAK